MALNTYFKVIVFEIFVFEYDFRCTGTRRVGTRTRTRGVGTRTRTRESPYLPSSVIKNYLTYQTNSHRLKM